MKRFRTLLTIAIVAGNVAALSAILMVAPVSASGGVDACDEEVVSGCDCINKPVGGMLPVGCYDNGGEEHLCTDGGPCGQQT